MRTNGREAVFGELIAFRAIEQERLERVSERFGAVGLAKQAAAGFFDEFRERAVTRLHDGHAAGDGFDDVEAEGLAIRRGNAENGQIAEEVDFVFEADVRPKLDALLQSGLGEFFLQSGDILPILSLIPI